MITALSEVQELEARINTLFELGDMPASAEILEAFRSALNRGVIRVASPDDDAGGRQGWTIHVWVKRGLLLHQMLGRLAPSVHEQSCFEFDTLPRRLFTAADRVRIPSSGCYVRDGARLAPGVTCMPPSFISIGAFVDENAFLDSHTSVGLCAQIGKRVRISAGAQIGGMIEPIDRLPNILCDDVIVGSNAGIFDGVYVSEGAVITAGVQVTRHSRLFDPAKRVIHKAAKGQPLVIPPGAVIVAGAVPVSQGENAPRGLLVQSLIIAGHRDDPALEEDLYSELLAS